MSYAVQTPVYEGPFDLLLHLILREQVDLYEVSLSAIVDAYLTELERMDDARPRRRHRVPAHRRAPWSSSRPSGSCPTIEDVDLDDELALLRGARPPARPPARVQDVQGRGRGARAARCRAPAAACPRAAGLEEPLPRARARPARRRHADDARGRRTCAPSRRSRCRRSTSTTSAPVRASVSDAVEELLDELPRAGRISVPRAHRGARRSARGGGALPRGARALQAGPRRHRPGHVVRRHRDQLDRRRRRLRVRTTSTLVDVDDG